MCDINLPGIEQLGSLKKVKSVPAVQVTWLLPSLTASELEQVTSTIVPVSTGNCVVVFIVLVHSVFSPVHIGAVEVLIFNFSEIFTPLRQKLSCYDSKHAGYVR